MPLILKDVVNYKSKYWVFVRNRLNAMTSDRFGHFFNNKIKCDPCLSEEFAEMLSDQFAYMENNQYAFFPQDVAFYGGKWKNGDLSVDEGIRSQFDTPNKWDTAAIIPGIKDMLKVYHLNSRLLNNGLYQAYQGSYCGSCGGEVLYLITSDNESRCKCKEEPKKVENCGCK